MASSKVRPDMMAEALNLLPPAKSGPLAGVVSIGPAAGISRAEVLAGLKELRLNGMRRAYAEQMNNPAASGLSFEQRLKDLLDRERLERGKRRSKLRLAKAGLKTSASLKRLYFQSQRGITPAIINSLAGCAWIDEHQNLLVTGQVGSGKTFIAGALARRACLKGYRVLYERTPTLLRKMSVARGRGRLESLLAEYAKLDLLALDDWGLHSLQWDEQCDLLELLEDRCGRRSTLVASVVPVDEWPNITGDSLLAESVLDRLIPGSKRLALAGGSMRDSCNVEKRG